MLNPLLYLRFLRYLTLQVEVTTACNLNCKICLRKQLNRPDRFLSLENFKRIVNATPFTFGYIGLHGWGEPLLNPEIFEMARYAKSRKFSVNLTTNGTLVSKNIDNILKGDIDDIAFGVFDKSKFERVSPQIREFIDQRNKRKLRKPKAYLDITVYNENTESIPELLRMAKDIGLDGVSLHRLFNVYGVNQRYITEDEEKEVFGLASETAKKLGLALYLPPKHTFPCRVVKYSLFVNIDMEVTPCTYLPTFSVGKVSDGIGRVMSSRKYRDFVKNMKENSVCSRCNW